MQQFSQWTLDTIRNFEPSFSWIEERRVEWITIVASSIKKLMDGYTFIIVTDDENKWFSRYLTQYINKNDKNRPLLPFYSIDAFVQNSNINTKEGVELLDDMLSISFNEKYLFFYIGKSNHPKSSIAKRKDDSLLWIMDEKLHNSFYLDSKDDMLDIKLIQLTKLLDKSIEAALFGQTEF